MRKSEKSQAHSNTKLRPFWSTEVVFKTAIHAENSLKPSKHAYDNIERPSLHDI